MQTPVNVNVDLFKAPKRQSTVDTVIERIKELLLTKKLKPGDRLPSEFELTQSLSASRGSVREALKVLESYGVLEIKRGDGTYVSNSISDTIFDHLLFQIIFSDVDKKELIELRELIEMGILKMIIKNATQADFNLIEEKHLLMEQKVKDHEINAKEFTKCDLAFHHALGKATKNPLIEKIYNFTLELFTPSIEATHLNKKEGINALRLHNCILQALKAKDYGKALVAMEESIEQWNELS